jgi:hypothetical protein
MSTEGRARRSTTIAVGIAVAATYVAAAAISGHLGIFARRPLLDGFAPPPPYRWVSPPPSLAGSNQPPLSGKATIPFQNGKSQAGVFRTNDSQLVLVLLGGAIPPKSGQTSVQLTIDPFAPKAFPVPPPGQAITGNVYRVRAIYQPGGTQVRNLAGAGAELVMVYPAPPKSGIRHQIIESPTGKKVKALKTSDSQIQHQVSTEQVRALGFFAITAPSGSGIAEKTSGGGSPIVVIVVVVAIVVLVVVAFVETRRRRRSDSGGRSGSSGPPRRQRR